jgi:hypothetical protein
MSTDASSSRQSSHVRERQAGLIRVALLLGVLLFGGVIWFLHRDPGFRPRSADDMEGLRLATYAVWGVAIAGVLILRGVHARARDDTRISTAIMGWAVGEAAALVGGVYYFMSDVPWRYLYGIVFMLATYILFPLRRR